MFNFLCFSLSTSLFPIPASVLPQENWRPSLVLLILLISKVKHRWNRGPLTQEQVWLLATPTFSNTTPDSIHIIYLPQYFPFFTFLAIFKPFLWLTERISSTARLGIISTDTKSTSAKVNPDGFVVKTQNHRESQRRRFQAEVLELSTSMEMNEWPRELLPEPQSFCLN